MEEKNELIKELFKLWENLYEVGEIYAGYGFTDNYKRLEAKVKNLTIPDVVEQSEQFYCVDHRISIGKVKKCENQCTGCWAIEKRDKQ